MQNSVWIDLLRRIPAELQNQIVLVTDSRAEIAVETLFRFEDDFVVFRGRTAGTTDNGMLFMVPYDRLTSIMVARELKEAEVHRLFPTAAENDTVHNAPKAKETEQDIEITPSVPLVPAAEPKPENKPVERANAAMQEAAKTTVSARGPTESSIAARNSLLDRLKAARHVSTGR